MLKIILIFLIFALPLQAQIMTNSTYKITSDTFDCSIIYFSSSNGNYQMTHSVGQTTPMKDCSFSTNLLLQSGYLPLPLLPLDTTPPGNVTELAVVLEESGTSFTLNWKNPIDSDLAGIRIVRKIGSAPASTNDGLVIIINNNSTVTYKDTGLERGTHYYYRIYNFDYNGNISSGVTADAETLSGLGKNKFKVKKSAINLNNGDVMEFEYNAEPGAEVYFEIYTITGTLVKKIIAQEYRGYWQGNNKKDKDVASGFYFVMMRVNGRIVNKKPLKIGVIR